MSEKGRTVLIIFLIILFFHANIIAERTKSNFTLKKINNEYVPFQGEIPYPQYNYVKDSIVDLNGKWKVQKFKADHDLSMEKRTEKTIRKLEKEGDGCYKINFNDSKWEKKNIPHVNNPFPSRYQDGMWYRRNFTVSAKYRNKNLRLFFEAVNYTADVWINGKHVGFHEGGYTPFVFDITKYVNYGKKNIISVRVDNIPWMRDNELDKKANKHDIIPYKTVDWWNYGGIVRDVYIKISEPVHIVRADIKTLKLNKKAEVKLNVILHNTVIKQKKLDLKYKIYKANVNNKNITSLNLKNLINYNKLISQDNFNKGPIQMDQESVKVLSKKFKVKNIKPWSPADPHLYILHFQLYEGKKLLENYYSQIGFRIVRTNQAQIKLNGKRIILKGVARHEEYVKTGRAVSYKDIKKVYNDFLLIKDLNADFIRTSHYPNHPISYILADRMGFAIMEEIPVMWFDGPEMDFQRLKKGGARQMWLEMIYRDLNRPSILFWSTCNECGWWFKRRDFITDLKKTAYKVDGTRLVGQSAVAKGENDLTHDTSDYVGQTSYYGIFYDKSCYHDTKEALKRLKKNLPGRPVIATEIGFWSEINWSQIMRQVEVANKTYRAYKESDISGGVCWWSCFDWFTMNNNPYQTMGLITRDRRVFKPVFFELQRLFGDITKKALIVLTPKKGSTVQGSKKVRLMIHPKFKMKSLAYRVESGPYKSIKYQNKKNVTFNLNTRRYKDGETYLTFRAKDINNKIAMYQTKFFIDNQDNAPEIGIPDLPKMVDQVYYLRVMAKDDRSDIKVQYSLDGQKRKNVPLLNKSKHLYGRIIDVSYLKDNTEHTINIFISAGKMITRKVKFRINRKKAVFVELPFNMDLISYNVHRSDGGDQEWTFPAEEMPKGKMLEYSLDNSGIKFLLGSKEYGEKNVLQCDGQTLDVPEGKYKNIHVFGYSYWGNQKNGIKLEYDDDTIEEDLLFLSEWSSAIPYFNDKVAWYCGHHHEPNKEREPDVAFYRFTIPCNPKKILEKIHLPKDDHKRIFAITLEEVK